MRGWICAASLFLAACAPASDGFLGAYASPTAMTSTLEGCAYSFLFSDFAAPGGGAAENARRPQTRVAGLHAPARIAGRPVLIELRGMAAGGPGAIGSIEVTFAGARERFELASGESAGVAAEPFSFTMRARAAAGENALHVTIALADPATPDQQIVLDSIDLAVDARPACRLEE